MPLKYPRLQDLKRAYDVRTDAGFDNYTICTGDVGNWKSLWLRKFGGYVSRRPLTVNGIHFTFEDWANDFAGLKPGDTIIRDEWDAHKRMAMHGSRLEELDTNKEGRQIGANAFFAYPDAGEVDLDLLKRFKWWHDKPTRKEVIVREIVKKLVFDQKGKPTTSISYPIVGRYPVTGRNDPLRWEYEEKKEARMRERNNRFRAEQAEPAVAAVAAPVRPALLNPALVSKWAGVIQDELKRSA